MLKYTTFYDSLRNQQCEQYTIARPANQVHQLFQSQRQLVSYALFLHVQHHRNLLDAFLF